MLSQFEAEPTLNLAASVERSCNYAQLSCGLGAFPLFRLAISRSKESRSIANCCANTRLRSFNFDTQENSSIASSINPEFAKGSAPEADKESQPALWCVWR